MSGANWWYDTARPVRFTPFMHGWAALCIPLFIAHISWGMLAFSILWMLLFILLETIRMPVPMALRRLRRVFAGRHRPARRLKRTFI